MWRTSVGLILTTAMAVLFYNIDSLLTPSHAKTRVTAEDVTKGNICLSLALPALFKLLHVLTTGTPPLREGALGAVRVMIAPSLSGVIVAPLVYLLSALLTKTPSLPLAYALSLLAVGPHAATTVLVSQERGYIPSVVEQGKRSFSLLLGNGGRKSREAVLLSRSAMGVLLGGWAASVVVPLDWEREWQVFPTPALVGALAGLAITALPVWVGGGSPRPSKSD